MTDVAQATVHGAIGNRQPVSGLVGRDRREGQADRNLRRRRARRSARSVGVEDVIISAAPRRRVHVARSRQATGHRGERTVRGGCPQDVVGNRAERVSSRPGSPCRC